MDPLVNSMRAALEANPDDVPMRLHLSRLLFDAGQASEALGEATEVLRRSPGNVDALTLISTVALALRDPSAEPPTTGAQDFDWQRAEQDVNVGVEPPFVRDQDQDGGHELAFASVVDEPPAPAIEETRDRVTLDDVGGLEQVKRRLRVTFLEPMRNPEIAKAFGKNTRGGLVLYGPPGCGKTFMARAIAGELGARFLTVSLADVLGSHVGDTEQNLHRVFEEARAATPAVLFLDEVDSFGLRRSSMGGSQWMRSAVNQLLMELDSMSARNDGLFVLGATNHPWDLDSALLRPGRFDRMLLVLPPDGPAREAILRHNLQRRPVAGINLDRLVAKTENFSGADLTHLCDTAAENAMTDSLARSQLRPIGMQDFKHALREVKPSIMPWLQSARNVAEFANSGGQYDDLVEYLKLRKIL